MKLSNALTGTLSIAFLCGASAWAQTAAPSASPAGGGTSLPTPVAPLSAPPASLTPSGSPSSTTSGNLLPAAVDVPDNYQLNVDDTINIEVARHGDVSRGVRIPVDGRVRLLRLNAPVLVVGKTCAQVADELTQRLQSEGKLRLRPGQVTVSVAAMRPHRIYIRGNMISNREVNLVSGWRVSELVAEIGGVPDPKKAIVTRIQNSDKSLRPEPVVIDLAHAINTPDSPDNILLMEGDTFYMQGAQNKRLIVIGEGPRGTKEADERVGLRDALNYNGFSPIGATGDLRNATLRRHTKSGDPTSPVTSETVDLYKLLTDKTSPDYQFNDLDELEIQTSKRFVNIQGAIGGPKKWYMPEDRKTYLSDVMQWGTYANAKIGSVEVRHYAADGETETGRKSYDFGKYQSKGDLSQNPEIKPGDMVYVPQVKRTDPNVIAGGVFTSWSLFNILKAVVPGMR